MPPSPLWLYLLEGSSVGLQFQDSAEQGIVGAQLHEVGFRAVQTEVNGEGGGQGARWEMQTDPTCQGHSTTTGSHSEAAEGPGGKRGSRARTLVPQPLPSLTCPCRCLRKAWAYLRLRGLLWAKRGHHNSM